MAQLSSSSFRDPSGFVFFQDGIVYRQINQVYQEDYQLLRSSGLYDDLVQSGLLIPHQEVEIQAPEPTLAYKVIQPERFLFESYPFEWCFSQLKDAALTTLAIQKKAIAGGLSLKDASAYNIQFHKGRPIFIDTLSFERYVPSKPWVAFRQFCQHFLAPLALMARTDVRLSQFLRASIDGIPMDLASKLLPFGTWFRPSYLMHIHLHAWAQNRFSEGAKGSKPTAQPASVASQPGGFSQTSMLGLIDSLEGLIRKLIWAPRGTEWAEYYTDTNYTPTAFQQKQDIVRRLLQEVRPQTVWDLGGNIGTFSRLDAESRPLTVCFDLDPAAVEKNYLETRKRQETNLLPLVLDLGNPSSGIGWAHSERSSLLQRGPADLVMALALIHHLRISNNVPFPRIAQFFSQLGRHLLLEFVPKSDSQVQRLLASREDIFADYTEKIFEESFAPHFSIQSRTRIEGSERTLYLLQSRSSQPA